MSDVSRRFEELLQRLVQLAGDAHDELAKGSWETAAPLQDAFDESFAALQALTARGDRLGREHLVLLQRLASIHADNARLASELRSSASTELDSVRRVRRVNAAYSPLGANHRPSPRYVDGAA